MPRLCERPGCAAPAAVAYGMEHEQLVVWLEPAPEGPVVIRAGLVCRRHADAMVVPRGWTLDDRREPWPRLFKVVDTDPLSQLYESKRPARTRAATAVEPQEQPQLVFDDVEPDPEELIEAITVGEIRPLGEHDPEDTQALPWRPQFDEGDDLGGLLLAKSPLLSRAFKGLHRDS